MTGVQVELLKKGIIFLSIAAIGVWALDAGSDMTTCFAILLLPVTAFFGIYGIAALYFALFTNHKRKDSSGSNDIPWYPGSDRDGR